jgi:hypothetical protein
MTEHIERSQLTRLASVSAMPFETKVDRNFNLPTGLYVATVGAYFAFLAVLSAALMARDLVIPMAICAIYLMMAFGVPMLWARINPAHAERALSWGEFSRRGIMTNTGQLTGREASVQVLILPVLILFWGLAVAIIVAVV